jgi:membrane AbrB-like protein
LFDWTVLSLCAIGGYALARRLTFPGGYMIFPMLLSVAVHGSGVTQAAPPQWLITTVQIVIGGVVGARFVGIKWREMRHVLTCGLGWAVALLALAAVSAWASAPFIDRSFLAMLLALAPGGMVEMTILTLSVGFEVIFVVTCQISRILFVLLLAPTLFGLLTGASRREGESRKPPESPSS